MKLPDAVLPLLLIAVLLLAPALLRAQEPDPELVRLRHQWAMRYLEPGPHMELARYFRQKGDLLQAFYILENARRNRFPTEVFDAAFLKYFGGFAPLDNSRAEEDKYLAIVKASPNDIRALTHLADIYVSRSEYVRAEPLFKRILEKEPHNYTAVGALAEVYRRQNTPEKAKQITDDFAARFPDTADGYRVRIERLLQPDPAAAKKLAEEAVAKFPNEGQLWFLLGLLAESGKKLDEAEEHYVKAARLEKNADAIQARAAIFFRVHRGDNEHALGYYLNTYFLDPHAHFDGFAEAKITSVNADLAEAKVNKLLTAGRRAEDLLSDPNPMVVVFAMAKVREKWSAASADQFVRLLRHDDVLVRWLAMLTLREKADPSLDPKLRTLLRHADLRVRGLAAYLAVSLWKQKSFPEMKLFLAHESQLIRFDTLSALVLYGGPEGLQIARSHKAKEPNETLRQMIDRAGSR